MAGPMRLDIWDYAAFSLIVILSTFIGIYHVITSKKSKDPQEFLVKSTDLGIIPLILSAAATFISAIGILGLPTETYHYGVHFMFFIVAYLLCIPIGLYTFLPVFYNLNVNSIYEYFELRFNRRVRIFTSGIITLQLTLYTSCAVYAPALALNQVTGLDVWTSVASIGVLCILYTAMGGIKAVVWVDAVQFTIMIGVVILVVFKGIIELGGVSEIWRICQEGNRSQFLLWEPSNESVYTAYTFLFGGTIHILTATAGSQLLMQRYVCNKTLKDAKISYIGSVAVISVMILFMTFSGLILYARYHSCDPLLNGEVTSRDQLLALYAMETLSFCPGLPGVFIAAITCATLSTLSSSLNSIATIVLQDYIKLFFPNISKRKELNIAKVVAIITGVICIILVFFAERIGGLMKAVFMINGATCGPVNAAFAMGMLFPWINSPGVIAGLSAGLLLNGWASVGSLLVDVFVSAPISVDGCELPTNASLYNISMYLENSTVLMDMEPSSFDGILPLYTCSPLWYGVWNLGIGIPVAFVVSLMTGVQDPKDVDSKLLFPWVENLFQLLPMRVQEYICYPLKDKYHHIPVTEVSNTTTKSMLAVPTLESTTNSLMALMDDSKL